MKINWKILAVCVVIPLVVGGVSAVISMGGMEAFETLNQPPLSPPGWLFPVVWTMLYVLMGIASYLIWQARASKPAKESALKVYALQLFFNFFWSIIFFNLKLYWFAFVWLLVLWVLILQCIRQFYPISKTAAYLMIPYLVWVTFAGYLNAGIAMLN